MLSKVIDWFKFPRVVVVIPDEVLSFPLQSKYIKTINILKMRSIFTFIGVYSIVIEMEMH